MMDSRQRDAQQSAERRRCRRMKLAVSVRLSTRTARDAGGVPWFGGESRDLNLEGAYVTVGECGFRTAGEDLTVSIQIPVEARPTFPFSRIVGPCRIVRVDRLAQGIEGKCQGLALEFCPNELTALGAI